MSGPIVRSAPRTSYTKNWENVFAEKPAKSQKKKAASPKKKATKKKKK